MDISVDIIDIIIKSKNLYKHRQAGTGFYLIMSIKKGHRYDKGFI
ncbi:MAG: hypothetical protein ACYCSW_05820 [bacterium]